MTRTAADERTDPRARRRPRGYRAQVYIRFAAVSAFLLILVVLGLYAGFRRLAVAEVTERTVSTLLLQEQVFDSLHAWAVPSVLDLLSDPVVNSSIYGSRLTVLDLTRASNRIANAAASNPLVHSIYLYNPSAGLVLSTTHGVERDVSSDPSLVQTIHGAPGDTASFIPRRMSVRTGVATVSEDRVLTLIAYDQIYHQGPETGCIVLNLDEATLRRSFLERTGAITSRVMITAPSGVALSHWDSAMFGEQVVDGSELEDVLSRPGQVRTQHIDLAGERTLVVAYRDPSNAWIMVSLTNEERMTAGLMEFRNVMVGVFLATLAGAFVAAYFVARQLSRPIQRVTEHARLLVAATEPQRTDSIPSEIEYVDSVLQQLGDRVAELSAVAQSGQESRQLEMLRRLLQGPLPESGSPELPQELADASSFLVAVVRLDGYQRLIEAVDSRTIRSMLQSISSVVTESFATPPVAIDLGRDHLALIHAATGHDLEERYRRLADYVADKLRSTVTIGLGRRVGSPDAIPDSYDQALDATDDRFRLGSGQVIPFDKRESPNADYRFPSPQARHIVEEIRLGHGPAAFEACEQILVEASAATYSDFRYAIEALVRTIRQEIGDHAEANAESRTFIRNLAESAGALDTVDDVLEAFDETIRALARSSNSHRLRRAQKTVERVKAFVDEHLTDPNLSVDLAAEHVGLSSNYLREVFREVAGDSLSAHIVNHRLELARELLTTTDQPVKDVAVACGFANYNYFFTLFKRRVGATPNEFRRNASAVATDRN